MVQEGQQQKEEEGGRGAQLSGVRTGHVLGHVHLHFHVHFHSHVSVVEQRLSSCRSCGGNEGKTMMASNGVGSKEQGAGDYRMLSARGLISDLFVR